MHAYKIAITEMILQFEWEALISQPVKEHGADAQLS